MFKLRFAIKLVVFLICSQGSSVHSLEPPVPNKAKETKKESSAKHNDSVNMSRAVFSSQKIKRGEFFTKDSLRVVEIDMRKLPPHAFGGLEPLLERRAKEDIPKNTMINLTHIAKDDLYKWTNHDSFIEREFLTRKPKVGYGIVLYPLRYIPEGSRIDGFCVDVGEVKLSVIPKDAVKSYKGIFGRTAKSTICQGEIIRDSHLAENNKSFNEYIYLPILGRHIWISRYHQ